MWVLYPVAGIISLGIILPVGYYTHVGYNTQTMLGIIPSDEFASEGSTELKHEAACGS